jgi:hypothetical protein
MKPVSPVVKGIKEVLIAKDQPEYVPLPAIVGKNGMVISRWRMSIAERIKALFTGSIYVHVLTFNHPLQPQLLSVDAPTKKERDE